MAPEKNVQPMSDEEKLLRFKRIANMAVGYIEAKGGERAAAHLRRLIAETK
jgi:hypothetical protein